MASSVEPRTPGSGHAKKRSGGRGVLNGNSGDNKYGPLGPLDDDEAGWGGRANGNGYGNGHGHGGGGKGKRI